MNIIFLEAVQSHGGARKSTLELAERLTKQKHTTHIVDFWGNCEEFVEDAKSRNLPIKILDPRDSAIIIQSSRNPFLMVKKLTSLYLGQKKMKKVLDDYIEENKINYIVVNNSKTLSLLKKDDSYKIIFFARGWFNLNSIPKLKRVLYRKRVDYFFGVSQSTRQSVFAGDFAPLKNIFVVPNAIDIEKIEKFKKENPVPKTEKLKILHCGGFLKEKGQLLTIDLAERLKSQRIDFEITIVGSLYDGVGSKVFYEEVKELIRIKGLENNVKIVLNSKNPYQYFHETDMLIHPSYTEGLPRVVMEALAFKKPVIANAVGGVTDFILNNYTGIICDFNMVDDYFNAVTNLHNNRAEYERLTENGYQLLLAGYTPDKQVNKFEDVLKKL
jgi:glycosyltransferase involved in cell wall biosynthesis